MHYYQPQQQLPLAPSQTNQFQKSNVLSELDDFFGPTRSEPSPSVPAPSVFVPNGAVPGAPDAKVVTQSQPALVSPPPSQDPVQSFFSTNQKKLGGYPPIVPIQSFNPQAAEQVIDYNNPMTAPSQPPQPNGPNHTQVNGELCAPYAQAPQNGHQNSQYQNNLPQQQSPPNIQAQQQHMPQQLTPVPAQQPHVANQQPYQQFSAYQPQQQPQLLSTQMAPQQYLSQQQQPNQIPPQQYVPQQPQQQAPGQLYQQPQQQLPGQIPQQCLSQQPQQQQQADDSLEADRRRLAEIQALRKQLEEEQERERAARAALEKGDPLVRPSIGSGKATPKTVSSERDSNGLKPGEWACAVCTFHNSASQSACEMCGTTKPCAQKSEKKASFQKSTWVCSLCTFENKAEESHCRACNTRRRAGDSLLPDGTTAATHSRPRHSPGPTPSGPGANEYACPTCTLHNPRSVTACEVCGTPNPNPPAPKPYDQVAYSIPSQPGYPGASRTSGVMQHYQQLQLQQAQQQRLMMTGKWACPRCTFENSSQRRTCDICGALSPLPAPRPSTTPPKDDDDDEVEWQKDEAVTACNKCRSSFGLLLRRHHCRKCGYVFCYYCCNHYATRKDGTQIRVCTDCFKNTP